MEKQRLNPMINMCYEKYDGLNVHTKLIPPVKKAKEIRNRCNLDRKCYE